jgi:hypothetical protein
MRLSEFVRSDHGGFNATSDRGLPPWRPHGRFRRVQTGGALLSRSRSAKPPPPDKQQQGQDRHPGSGDNIFHVMTCFARELVDRDKGGRPPALPRSRSSGRLCGITVGAHPTADSGCRVSTSAAALRTASDGRHGQGVRADWSGASHSRSRTVRRERHATEHRASRASAQAATGRSLLGHRTQPDQIGPCRLQLQMQPQRHRPKIGVSL